MLGRARRDKVKEYLHYLEFHCNFFVSYMIRHGLGTLRLSSGLVYLSANSKGPFVSAVHEPTARNWKPSTTSLRSSNLTVQRKNWCFSRFHRQPEISYIARAFRVCCCEEIVPCATILLLLLCSHFTFFV